MMSKKIEPKEALKVLKDNIHYSLYELNEATKNDTNSRLIRSIRTLDELVDKATPKKPDKYVLLERDSLGFPTQGYCKKCGTSLLVKNNYCGHCGQKLDWSENDE